VTLDIKVESRRGVFIAQRKVTSFSAVIDLSNVASQ
jgi:hypothetical protein